MRKNPRLLRLLKTVQMQGGRRKAGYPPQAGSRRTPGTPQRVPQPFNAADGPFFSSLCRAESQRAVRRSRASSPRRPTSWTPSGRPRGPRRSGSVTAGTPHSVQAVQKMGLPVEVSPAGASPVVAGVRMASYRAKIASRAWISPRHPLHGPSVVHGQRSLAALDHRPQGVAELLFAPPVLRIKTKGQIGFHDGAMEVRDLGERRRQRDLLRTAEAARELRETPARVRVGVLPERRFDERQPRAGRGVLVGGLEEARQRLAAHRRVPGVVHHQGVGKQGGVLHGAREDADMVQVRRLAERADPGDEAERRLEPDDAAVRRRSDHRAVGLRPDGQRHHPGGDGRGRTAGGAAGGMGGIVRIPRLAGTVHGQLGRHGLADDDRPRGAQQRHGHGVLGGLTAGVQDGAVLRGHIRGVEDVLDTDRQTVEGAEKGSLRRARDPGPGLGPMRARVSRKVHAWTRGSTARIRSRHARSSAVASNSRRWIARKRVARSERGGIAHGTLVYCDGRQCTAGARRRCGWLRERQIPQVVPVVKRIGGCGANADTVTGSGLADGPAECGLRLTRRAGV